MFDVFALSMAMSVSQAGSPVPAPTALPPFAAVPQNAPAQSGSGQLINPMRTQRSVISVDAMPSPSPFVVAIQPTPMPEQIAPKNGNGGAKNGDEKKDEEKKDDEKKDDDKKEEEKPPEKGFFMKALEGTAIGQKLDDRRITISGWTESSYTGSGAKTVNLPVVWNDRANEFLLQQHWMRFDKDVDTKSKDISFGWRVDAMFGTDYRYMLIRDLFNSQLLNHRLNSTEPGGFQQNLYGYDLPQFYTKAFLPNLFEGTEVRLGRFETPWGMESVEATSSPLLSKSYAFNWSPPFFHTGLAMLPKFNNNWAAFASLVLGNDVFIGPAAEFRFVGNLQWKSDDGKDNVTLATSVGRGKFNAGVPFNPATNGLQSEAAGRNNFNAFDIVLGHQINDKWTYNMEGIYAYQTGVPTSGSAIGNVSGTVQSISPVSAFANWFSVAQYLTYVWTDQLSSILRAEVFDDFQGQRTGYKGFYYAATYGFQYKPYSWLWIRPEIRWDYNGYARAFNYEASAGGGTSHSLWTAATDVIIRW